MKQANSQSIPFSSIEDISVNMTPYWIILGILTIGLALILGLSQQG